MTTPAQQRIETTLANMTPDQKIAQLLHPFVRPHHSDDQILASLDGLQPGGVFVMAGTSDDILRTTRLIQSTATTPVIISSDLECGPGRMIKDTTGFPVLMSLAATRDKDLAYTMGRAAAREGRAVGIHWNFAPVVDINLCPQNPITNTRSFGDNTDTIIDLASQFIAGMQENNMAACAKHFPGDGLDSRDQHICTSINPLDLNAWRNSFGRIYKHLIDHGLMSIMIGHIALPAFDPGDNSSLSAAPPATLSTKLTTDLLRTELGFDGLIISDASVMGGITTWGSRETIVPQMINAGCDQVLFCDFRKDFEILTRAANDGHLSQTRIDDAVRRILRLKQQLGLFDDVFGPATTDQERQANETASQKLAANALTIAANRFNTLPIALQPGAKVASIHLRADETCNVDTIDKMLQEKGLRVTTRTEKDPFIPAADLDNFDAVLVHVVYCPSWNTNCIRPCGNYLRDMIPNFPLHNPRLIFISYGTPYLLHDWPNIPTLINAYSPDPATQQAVTNLLTKKTKPTGQSPVNLQLDKTWFNHRQPT